MERIDERIQSLATLMVLANLSANETNGACVFPIKATAHEPIDRPDTYERLPLSLHASLAKGSRSIHRVGLLTST